MYRMTIFIFHFYIPAIPPNQTVTLKLTLVHTRVDSRGVILDSFFTVFIPTLRYFFVFSGMNNDGIYYWKMSVLDFIAFYHIKLFSQARQCFYYIPYLY